MSGELIITNGDSAAGLLKAAGIGDAVLPWRDVLHEGPVRETDDLSALSLIRARYLHDAGHGDLESLQREFIERDDLLARNEDFDDVSLWFEHDLYDQLQLLQILAWFADHWRDDGHVFLVQADDYLGMQTVETIGLFAEKRLPVSGLQLSMAKIVWVAFRHDTPEPWAKLLEESLTALPFLKAAVLRMLEELPDKTSGLGRVEQKILSIIADGTTKTGRSFAAYLQTEETQFLGDTSYFTILEGLVSCNTPLIARNGSATFDLTHWDDDDTRKAYFQSQLTLTEFGKDILAKRADFATANTIDRWWGGTHLTNANLWRWDRTAQNLLAP